MTLEKALRFVGRKWLAATFSVGLIVAVFYFVVGHDTVNFDRFCDSVEYILTTYILGNIGSKTAGRLGKDPLKPTE